MQIGKTRACSAKGKERLGIYNQFKSVQLQFPEKYWNK